MKNPRPGYRVRPCCRYCLCRVPALRDKLTCNVYRDMPGLPFGIVGEDVKRQEYLDALNALAKWESENEVEPGAVCDSFRHAPEFPSVAEPAALKREAGTDAEKP